MIRESKVPLRSLRVRFWSWLTDVLGLGRYVDWDAMTLQRDIEDADAAIRGWK